MPFGWRLRGDIQRVQARGSHHPPVAQACKGRLLVPISVLPAKLAGKSPKNKRFLAYRPFTSRKNQAMNTANAAAPTSIATTSLPSHSVPMP